MEPSRDPGSFRDPLSRVFLHDDAVVRALRGEGVADLEALEATQFFARAIDDGRVVGTARVDLPADLDGAGWEAALVHDRIPFISYPYEWTFSMLQDAALSQLRLTREALAEKMLTKDATPYNTQFVGTEPVFIDVGSFERLRPGEPWFGYRQFCQLFLYPLLLQAKRDLPFQPWLRGSLEGISPDECRSALRRRDLIGDGVFTHVVLHARAERKNADTDRDVRAELKKAGFGPKIIDAQLAKLEQIVRGLKWRRSESTWSDYSDRGHYSDVDLAAKEEFVRRAVVAEPRRQVLDIGANDGHFSRIAAEHAEQVVAVDIDPLVIDRLYRRLRDDGEARVLPLTMNLADSSPPLGWRSMERPSFIDRANPDLVLALALVHHLAITNTVPLEEFVAFLADLGGEIVVEFPTPEDQMVQRLLRNKRDGLFDHYQLEAFEKALSARFSVLDRLELPSGTRHLFHVRALG